MSHALTITNIPKEPAVRRVWICAQLRLRGKSLRGLAIAEGVSQQAMSAALLAPNIHLEPIIAAALGLTAETLFPERFDETGRRTTQTRPKQRTTRRPGCNVESGEAA